MMAAGIRFCRQEPRPPPAASPFIELKSALGRRAQTQQQISFLDIVAAAQVLHAYFNMIYDSRRAHYAALRAHGISGGSRYSSMAVMPTAAILIAHADGIRRLQVRRRMKQHRGSYHAFPLH